MMNSAEVLTALEQHQLDLGIIENPYPHQVFCVSRF